MNRSRGLALSILVLLACALPAVLPGNPVPVKTDSVNYRSGAETVSAYLAAPDSPGKHPAVIVIHEWWGLNDWAKEQARKFAAEGYVALAVDLYRGKLATTPDVAHELSRGLPPDRALRDLQAAIDYLAALPSVQPERIASAGWCMGGGYSIQLAVHEPRLAACIVNYGPLPTEPANLASIKAPVLGNFGADDRGIPPDAVRAFEAAMKAAGKSTDIKIYDGAGHAFENPNNKDGYRPAAAADAWGRMVAFLRVQLH